MPLRDHFHPPLDTRRHWEGLHTTWATFIRTGNPNNDTLPDWPTYSLANRSTMILNEVSGVLENPQAELLSLWAEIC